MPRTLFYSLLIVFTLSGFTGLIYESIWTHYLKLFLGHAAYAQTLVLSIFMGGMAIGAWLCSRYSAKWRNVILVYALIEAIIGASAIIFHWVFAGFLALTFDSIIPALGGSLLIVIFKWSSAAMLILPQSILLGMTFPLLASGFVRHMPQSHGKVIAVLYFCNSFGASIGVLASGFVLIHWVGLPGTIVFAGLVNIILAIVVWRLVSGGYQAPSVVETTLKQSVPPHYTRAMLLMLAVALFTGMASFIYEVVWIRMLSLVLGASTHAFELMLSAFIMGLALGGAWIRKRIDTLSNPRQFLGYVQLIMGCMALLTIPFYNLTFDGMQWLVQNLDKTDRGYAWFNLGSHVIAFLVMLPATFCAGMTLPLITHLLYKSSAGEQHIGMVYAANTLGAIAGILLTVHVLMPVLGLQWALSFGALIDIALACVLLFGIRGALKYLPAVAAVSAAVLVFLLTQLVAFDSYKMASGVYRHGEFYDAASSELLFHQDGKTASVDLVKINANGEVSIITNGKPDASVNMLPMGPSSPDEATMTLAAAIPLAIKHDARHAAIIGLGSGYTTHALLSAQQLERVDTIEIEEAIVSAANGFRPRVEHAYTHPAGRIHIEDAKTFFSTHNHVYDIIISEPSNPWVSGIAGLFTREFYRLVKRYLQQDGLFVQWLQLYEIEPRLVASVIKALSSEFAGYAIFASNNNDLVIVAAKHAQALIPSDRVFGYPELAGLLARLNIRNHQDLLLRRIGDADMFDALFASYDIEMNSDYYPVLDLNAVKSRFMQHNAMRIIDVRRDPFRSWQARATQTQFVQYDFSQLTPSRFYLPSDLGYAAMLIYAFIVHDQFNPQLAKLDATLRAELLNVKSRLIDCRADLPPLTENDIHALANGLQSLAQSLNAYLASAELARVWQRLISSDCFAQLPDELRQWVMLLNHLAAAEYAEVRGMASLLLEKPLLEHQRGFIVHAALVASIALGDKSFAVQLWRQYESSAVLEPQFELVSRMIVANALR